jgi:uracil-DNA glycosylase
MKHASIRDSEPMPLFASNPTGLARVQRLDAYFRDNVMRCSNLEGCQLSAERQGHCFNPVQLPHVGRAYDLSHNGQPWRIAVCGQEAGGAKGDESIFDRSPRMSKWGRDVSFTGRNPHMQGTTSALRLLFGRPLGSDHRDETIVIDGEYRHLFDAFTLINALICSSTAAATGKNGKATSQMKRNCVRHLRATVTILQPTVLVVQGNVAADMLREAFPDMRVGRQGAVIPTLGTIVALLAHPSARADQRRGDRERLDWARLDSPYLTGEVEPLLTGIYQRLLSREAGR